MSKDRKNCLRLVKINLGILDKMQKEEQQTGRKINRPSALLLIRGMQIKTTPSMSECLSSKI